MSWRSLVLICGVVLGVILFLYGANYYNATVGWTGVFLMVGGVFAEIILKVYEFAVKRLRWGEKKDTAQENTGQPQTRKSTADFA